MTKLKSYGLQDKVTFATLNVFGRTFDALERARPQRLARGLGDDRQGLQGRGRRRHRARRPRGRHRLRQRRIAAEGGDLGAGDSLASVAKTLGVGIGLTDAQVDDQITSGRAIRSVIAS